MVGWLHRYPVTPMLTGTADDLKLNQAVGAGDPDDIGMM